MTETRYVDAGDSDELHVTPGDDGVCFQHVRGPLIHSVNLDRDTVARLADQLTAWLRGSDCIHESPDPHQYAGEGSVAMEAHTAVYGDRQAAYGHPREDFTRTAVIWQGLLLHKLADGASIAAEDVARLMIGVKLARDVHSHQRDNRVDMAGYAVTLDRLETGR